MKKKKTEAKRSAKRMEQRRPKKGISIYSTLLHSVLLAARMHERQRTRRENRWNTLHRGKKLLAYRQGNSIWATKGTVQWRKDEGKRTSWREQMQNHRLWLLAVHFVRSAFAFPGAHGLDKDKCRATKGLWWKNKVKRFLKYDCDSSKALAFQTERLLLLQFIRNVHIAFAGKLNVPNGFSGSRDCYIWYKKYETNNIHLVHITLHSQSVFIFRNLLKRGTAALGLSPIIVLTCFSLSPLQIFPLHFGYHSGCLFGVIRTVKTLKKCWFNYYTESVKFSIWIWIQKRTDVESV